MNTRKPRIVILGLGSRTTLFYIAELNKRYRVIYGASDSCPLTLYPANFDNFNPYLPSNFEKLEPELRGCLMEMEPLKGSIVLMPNITLHETFDRLNSQICVIHPVHCTIEKCKETQLTKAVIFGSLYSMQGSYLRNAFQQKGIALVEPLREEKEFIDYFRKQVYHERENKRDIRAFMNLKQAYAEKYPVVVACTELSIFSSENEVNCYDMALIQIEQALQLLLS